jgi:hypothetical protein
MRRPLVFGGKMVSLPDDPTVPSMVDEVGDVLRAYGDYSAIGSGRIENREAAMHLPEFLAAQFENALHRLEVSVVHSEALRLLDAPALAANAALVAVGDVVDFGRLAGGTVRRPLRHPEEGYNRGDREDRAD